MFKTSLIEFVRDSNLVEKFFNEKGEQKTFEDFKKLLNDLGFKEEEIKKNGLFLFHEFNRVKRIIRLSQTCDEIFKDFFEVAKDFIKKQPLYYDKNQIWWFWNWEEGRWELIDETDILTSITYQNYKIGSDSPRVLKTYKSSHRREILEALRQVSRLNEPVKIPSTWVQFKDKIIDISNGYEYEVSPTYFTTNPIPWRLGDSDSTPHIDKLFKEWVGEEWVQTLYEIIAYCLLLDNPLQRGFILNGEGRNGKSTFQDLIAKFIGKWNIVSTELEQLISNRFTISELHKKLVCFMSETNFKMLDKTSKIKGILGNDFVSVEYKFKNSFTDKIYSKIIIATNRLPITKDTSEGFYRRWLIIDFPNKFEGHKDVLSEIPDKEFENLAFKCVKILKDLLVNRSFTNEGSIEERRKRYEERSNPVRVFFDKFIEEVDGERIPLWVFVDKLNAFCKQNNFPTFLDSRDVASELRSMGVDVRKARYLLSDEERVGTCLINYSFKEDLSLFEESNNVDMSTPYKRENMSKVVEGLSGLDVLKASVEHYKGNKDAVIKMLNTYGFDGVDFVEKALKEGIIYEPRPGEVRLLK